MDTLKDLFDQKILNIINVFLDAPEIHHNLTGISTLSDVNIATTSRILNKLIEKEFVKVTKIGKIRAFKLERNKKTLALMKLLKKDNPPIEKFIQNLSQHPRIKKIILESKQPKEAKIIIVGNFLPKEKIKQLCLKIKKEENFKIHFVEISESQYENLKNFRSYGLEGKIIWSKPEGL